MADFLSSSLCRGRRVRLVEALHVQSRSHLVTRLMQERGVPRFLVAPFGFGKTHLALDYAQTVFSLDHVSWIDCKSPCFLRDLDAGVVASRLLELDDRLRLVVFDDLPRLGAARADEFSRIVDDLLRAACEVLVCTTPTCDAYGRRQADRIRLGSTQLLVGEHDPCWEPDLAEAAATSRIPLLAWGCEDGPDKLVEGTVLDDLPDAVNLALFVLLAVGKGRMDDVRLHIPALSKDALRVLERGYLPLGLASDLESFESVDVSPDLLRRMFSSRMDALASCAGLEGRESLVEAVSRILLDAGERSRACDFVRALALRKSLSAWLMRYEGRTLSLSSLAAVSALSEVAPASKGAENHVRQLSQVGRLLLMGLVPLACDRAVALSARQGAPEWVRGWALCAAVSCARPDQVPGHFARLHDLYQAHRGGETQAGDVGLPDQELFCGTLSAVPGREWVAFARALEALVGRNEDPSAVWVAMEGASLSPGCRDLLAALMVREGSGEAACYVRSCFQPLGGWRDLDLRPTLALAGLTCLRSDDPDVRAYALDLSPDASALLDEAEDVLSQQRWAFRRIASARESRQQSRSRSMSSTRRAAAVRKAEELRVPILRVRLMGGLTVVLDGRDITSSFLRRRKVSGLLCLLALNAGREVPRSRVLEVLWPEKDPGMAMKNLYSVWSSLRSLLGSGGRSPYLERTQGGYRLDVRSLEIDVRQIRDLCRILRLEVPDPDAWRAHLADFDDLAVGPLLPSDVDNALVSRERDALANVIVDALLSSAERLLEQGHAQLAREFAARALEQGIQREETYYLNMRCLLACGCREAAIAMYFRNRAFLADELGIDPAAKVVELYRSILEEEHDF